MMMINDHDHQGAATDVPDGEGNTSVHAAVSANCKVTPKTFGGPKNFVGRPGGDLEVRRQHRHHQLRR